MLNLVTLMGRLTGDPELRTTPNNTPVTSFTLAVNRRKEGTDFIDIVAWNKTAEFVSQYFKKGQQVAVSGRLQARNWEDKEGNKRKSVEVVADNVYFADSKKETKTDTASYGTAPRTSDFAELSEDDGELPF